MKNEGLTAGIVLILLYVVLSALWLIGVVTTPEPTCGTPMERNQPACDRWESAPWRDGK